VPPASSKTSPASAAPTESVGFLRGDRRTPRRARERHHVREGVHAAVLVVVVPARAVDELFDEVVRDAQRLEVVVGRDLREVVEAERAEQRFRRVEGDVGPLEVVDAREVRDGLFERREHARGRESVARDDPRREGQRALAREEAELGAVEDAEVAAGVVAARHARRRVHQVLV
jgi:hypothetical protein